MKKRYMIGIIALLILLTLSGCGKESKPINLPTGTDLALEQVFEAEGKIYYLYSNWELRTRTRDYYLATEDMTDGTAYALNGLCTWHEGSGRLYYTEKHKLYSCDLQGGDKTLVWEWKEGKREDTLRVAACSEDRLLLRGAHGTRNYALTTSYYTGEYFSVDPISGAGKVIIPKGGYYAAPGILCTQGNEIFYLQVADGHYSDGINVTKKYNTVLIKRLDLVSGESRELGSFKQYGVGTGIAGNGCISGESLYFVLGGAERGHRIFEIPLAGGEVTERDTKYFGNDREKGEWVTPQELVEYDGMIYSRSGSGLFAWNRESGELSLINDGYTDADHILFSNGMYYLYTWKEVHSGKLLPDFVKAEQEGMTFTEKVVEP